jgi:predicted lipoprotein with Yx(FWY)xxD motif
MAPADAQPVGDFTLAARPDGSRQWALRGRPLYTFANDSDPGMTLGDGVRDIWHVAVDLAPRPSGVRFYGTVAGRVAATAKGMTLYVSPAECTGACLQTWKPLPAPWAARAVGDWTPVKRADDGTVQWAYRGQPVSTYAKDLVPGDLRGEGVDGRTAVVLQPVPPPPPWVTVQVSDFGPIFADEKGMTLYTLANNLLDVKKHFCNDACLKENWTPVLAAADAKPTGNWSIVTNENGRQWAYRAQIVYTHTKDKVPSDIVGAGFAVGNSFGGWKVIPIASVVWEPL